ncbi:hypothetical protein [Alterisphingorhabdus coralli]|uniref:Lipoprotein n=1 Tax=Alterisphingorhabdus coralli TaxID=3071408 RepID=A0AA97F8V4_9SPHN|nr:hypothetical protein [Parasphingorhabdus sp. SCSIO 66989]WOE76108.1 hypothetical protein RB602_05175 [Parasphingorhabdus sp. SCSIO 66989]
MRRPAYSAIVCAMIRIPQAPLALATCLLLCSGCIPSSGATPAAPAAPETASAPAAQPAPAPAPERRAAPLPADWRDWPKLDGYWMHAKDIQEAQPGPAAYYFVKPKPHHAKQQPWRWASISCEANGGPITFAYRTSKMREPIKAFPTTVITSFGERQINSSYSDPQGSAYEDKRITFSAPARDVIWDEIVYSRGSFALRLSDTTGHRIPNPPEIALVVEDCRS